MAAWLGILAMEPGCRFGAFMLRSLTLSAGAVDGCAGRWQWRPENCFDASDWVNNMIPYFTISPLQIPFPFGWTLFGVNHLSLQPFGLLVAMGVILGNWQALRYAVAQKLDPELLNRMVMPALIGGFIGAHLFAVAAYRPGDLARDWWKIWSGLSSFGGIFSGVVVLLIWARRNGVRLAPYADALVYGFVHAWVFGRAGCFIVHDHPGRLTSFFLSVKFPEHLYTAGQRFDLGLLELLFTILLLSVMRVWMVHLPRRNGQLAVWLGLIYSVVRFFLDFLRATDIPGSDLRYFGLTPAQYCCLALVVFCIYWLRGYGAEGEGLGGSE